MEGAEDVLQIARPGDWATSLDFRAAFNHICVDVELQPYLCFQFAGRCFQYQAMPFGLKQAPRTFTKLMKRAVAAIRERWKTRMVFYMDDSLLLFEREEQARTETREIAAYLTALGWTLAEDKCQMEPTQAIEFLGWRWDCAGAHVSAVAKRKVALLAEVKQTLAACVERSRVPTRALAGLIGKLNFLRLQSRDASLHLMALDAIKNAAVRAGGWKGYAVMHPGASGDLKWWARTLLINRPRPWAPPPTRAYLTTDASPLGWGVELVMGAERRFSYGLWNAEQRAWSSNARELTAVRMALQHLASELKPLAPLSVAVQSDNTTTVHDVNKRRAAASLAPHLRRLLRVCRQIRVELRASYLPGVENDTADRLSRMGCMTGYFVKPAVLSELLKEAHFEPTLDVFQREPEWHQRAEPARELSSPTDCLMGRWEGERLLLHPPLNFIARTLRRLRSEPRPALLIAPAWTSQPWSAALAEMVEQQFHLGPYDAVMETTPEFRRKRWRLPPGNVVASLLATRTTRAKPSSQDC
jgi:ribonuclease HI